MFNQVRDKLSVKHYSIRTEQSYAVRTSFGKFADN
jgi:hypothetical protein